MSVILAATGRTQRHVYSFERKDPNRIPDAFLVPCFPGRPRFWHDQWTGKTPMFEKVNKSKMFAELKASH
jgi:hypothetical protein